MRKLTHNRRLSVIGLGYVGLPVAVAFSAAGNSVVAFDISAERIAGLRDGHDRTDEINAHNLAAADLDLTTDLDNLRRADFHIVTVPPPITEARQPDLVGVLGLTFKGNVPELRNSRVPDILRELADSGIEPFVHDPLANPLEARREYGVALSDLASFRALDALILAAPHRDHLGGEVDAVGMLKADGVLFDVKSALDPNALPASLTYWSL